VDDHDRRDGDRPDVEFEEVAWQVSLPPVTKLVYVAMSRLTDRARRGVRVRFIEDLREMTGLPDDQLQHHAQQLVEGGRLELGSCGQHPLELVTPPAPPSDRATLRLVTRDGQRVG
jgi:hypothetical protein